MPTTIDGGTGASQIQDGTVTEAKIAAGAVTETKIAAGAVTETKIADGAVTAAKLAVGAISTTSVLAATAGASAGAVGTYAFLARQSGGMTAGTTYAGSELEWTSAYNGASLAVNNNLVSGGLNGVQSGTWRAMGSGPLRCMTLMLRIS